MENDRFKPKPLDAESIYELQKIDCNCNNCGYMVRNLTEFKKWEDWKRNMQFTEFERSKAKAISDAEKVENPNERRGMLFIANKMKFQFDRDGSINYGDCAKLNKPVSFIPGLCQVDTQDCFVHRKDMK